VSIAVELLGDPGLFFLDEPTSGLDPGLEKKMMYTMRQLADRGRTIVLVTHATANITQCTHVAFMADGRLVFFGPPLEAQAFFGKSDFADIYTLLTQPLDPAQPRRRPPRRGRRPSGRRRRISATWPGGSRRSAAGASRLCLPSSRPASASRCGSSSACWLAVTSN
jgi:ABC-type multidrug transport system ATPase subunit